MRRHRRFSLGSPQTGVVQPVLRPARSCRRAIEDVRSDEPDIAAKLRVEERELEAGGLN